MLRPATRLGDALAARIVGLPPVLVRALLALAFFETGRGKRENLEGTTAFLESLGIPFPGANAVVVATMEPVGGLALVAGAFTRFFAAGLAGTMVLALLTAHTADVGATQGASGLLDITTVAHLLLLSWLALHGAGSVAADRPSRARSPGPRRRRPAEAGGVRPSTPTSGRAGPCGRAPGSTASERISRTGRSPNRIETRPTARSGMRGAGAGPAEGALARGDARGDPYEAAGSVRR